MKQGDVVRKFDSNNNCILSLKVLEVGKSKCKCRVLHSRVFDFIGNLEMWDTRALKEMQGSEFYYSEDNWYE